MDKLHLHLLTDESGLINAKVQYHKNIKELKQGELIYKNIQILLNKYKYQEIIIHTNNYTLAIQLKEIICTNGNSSIKFEKEKTICKKENFFQTYINGLTLAITGVYPLWSNYDGIKHVIGNGEKPDLKFDFYRNINSTYISVNQKSSFKISNYLDVLELNYKDNEGVVKSINTNQIKKLYYSEFIYRSKIKFNFDTINIVTINDEKNLREFVEVFSEIEKNGLIMVEELNYLIKDECMWFGKDFCTEKSKLRFFEKVDSLFESPQCNCNNNLSLLSDYSNRLYSNNKVLKCFNNEGTNQLLRYYKEKNPSILRVLKLRKILKSFITASNITSGYIEFPTCKKSLSNRMSSMQILRNDYLIFKYDKSFYLYINKSMKFYKITYRTMLILEDLLQYKESTVNISKILEKR